MDLKRDVENFLFETEEGERLINAFGEYIVKRCDSSLLTKIVRDYLQTELEPPYFYWTDEDGVCCKFCYKFFIEAFQSKYGLSWCEILIALLQKQHGFTGESFLEEFKDKKSAELEAGVKAAVEYFKREGLDVEDDEIRDKVEQTLIKLFECGGPGCGIHTCVFNCSFIGKVTQFQDIVDDIFTKYYPDYSSIYDIIIEEILYDYENYGQLVRYLLGVNVEASDCIECLEGDSVIRDECFITFVNEDRDSEFYEKCADNLRKKLTEIKSGSFSPELQNVVNALGLSADEVIEYTEMLLKEAGYAVSEDDCDACV